MVTVKIPASKPRNPLVVPAIKKKAGKHAPSPGGERKRANDAASKEARDQAARDRKKD